MPIKLDDATTLCHNMLLPATAADALSPSPPPLALPMLEEGSITDAAAP